MGRFGVETAEGCLQSLGHVEQQRVEIPRLVGRDRDAGVEPAQFRFSFGINVVVQVQNAPAKITAQVEKLRQLVEAVARLGRDAQHLSGRDAEDAFDLVLPAIPWDGFSAEPTEIGWYAGRAAQAWAELMNRLGYARYVAQGGDQGASVTDAMGLDLYTAANTPGAIQTGSARVVITPGTGKTWFVVKGGANPTLTDLDTDYVGSSTNAGNFRQAIQ